MMKKYYFFILIVIPYLLLLNSCNSNSNTKKLIKKEIVTIYSVKNEGFIKDTIETKYEMEFDNNGTQKSFIGIKGYGTTDPNFVIPKFYKKVVDSITYYYESKTNKVSHFIVDKGDSSFQYSILSNEKPYLDYISINDSKKHLVKFIDLSLCKMETYLKTNYNENDDLTYALIQSDYYPGRIDHLLYSKEELLLKKSERRVYVKEISYIYY